MQCIIIAVFCRLNLFLDADVLYYHIAILIQKQKDQQSAHATVAVIERVNAEQVQNKIG